jgi:hypothetical protein
MPEGESVTRCLLLDERSRPDFRELYGRYATLARSLDAAVRRVRLGGIDLGVGEIGGLERLRLLLGEVNSLALSTEAEALACDPERRRRLDVLMSLLENRRLRVRIAPLAGWTPDFSVFLPPVDDTVDGRPQTGGFTEPTLMLGTHWFERPFPHPGPALAVRITGPEALSAQRRFEEIWRRAHDVEDPIRSILREALRRGTSPVRPG